MSKQKRFNKFGNFGIKKFQAASDCEVTRKIGDSLLEQINLAKVKLAELEQMKNLNSFQRKSVNNYKKSLKRNYGVLNYYEIDQIHTIHEDCTSRQKKLSEKPSIHLNKEDLDKLRLRLHRSS